MFEIVEDFDSASELYREAVMPLQKIPSSIKLPCMKERFNLREFVDWKPPLMTIRHSESQQPLGHYCTFCCRKGMWKQTDIKKGLKRRKLILSCIVRNSNTRRVLVRSGFCKVVICYKMSGYNLVLVF